MLDGETHPAFLRGEALILPNDTMEEAGTSCACSLAGSWVFLAFFTLVSLPAASPVVLRLSENKSQ